MGEEDNTGKISIGRHFKRRNAYEKELVTRLGLCQHFQRAYTCALCPS